MTLLVQFEFQYPHTVYSQKRNYLISFGMWVLVINELPASLK